MTVPTSSIKSIARMSMPTFSSIMSKINIHLKCLLVWEKNSIKLATRNTCHLFWLEMLSTKSTKPTQSSSITFISKNKGKL